jgi:hypothetical protein
MAVAFDIGFVADAEATDPLTSAAGTIASTADRYAFLGGIKSNTGTFNAGSLGGSMSVLEATFAVEYADAIVYGLLAPSSGSQTASIDYATAVPDFMALAGAVYNGVNQTTPIGTAPTSTSGSIETPSTTGSATITGTTETDGALVVVMPYLVDSGVAPTFTARTGTTVRANARFAQWGVMVFDRPNNAGSTEAGVDITIGSGNIWWRCYAYPLRPAGGGGSAIPVIAANYRRRRTH